MAADGTEGLCLYTEDAPDIVLLGFVLPEPYRLRELIARPKQCSAGFNREGFQPQSSRY